MDRYEKKDGHDQTQSFGDNWPALINTYHWVQWVRWPISILQCSRFWWLNLSTYANVVVFSTYFMISRATLNPQRSSIHMHQRCTYSQQCSTGQSAKCRTDNLHIIIIRISWDHKYCTKRDLDGKRNASILTLCRFLPIFNSLAACCIKWSTSERRVVVVAHHQAGTSVSQSTVPSQPTSTGFLEWWIPIEK